VHGTHRRIENTRIAQLQEQDNNTLRLRTRAMSEHHMD
jgi:hypothetical protein